VSAASSVNEPLCWLDRIKRFVARVGMGLRRLDAQIQTVCASGFVEEIGLQPFYILG
jgi:hypothetical protein